MENIHILIVEPGKAPYEATVPYTLKTMQKIVGGRIDATYPYQTRLPWCVMTRGGLTGWPSTAV